MDKVDILVVDDKLDNLTVLEVVLDSPDYRLIMAQSGPEALKKAEIGEYVCILLDVQMPGMDGFETAERLRAIPNTKNVPIIFVTAIHGDDCYVRKAYQSGAVDYIFKPFNADVLRSKVAVFVDLYRRNRTLLRQEAELRKRELAALKAERDQREWEMHQKFKTLTEVMPQMVWTTDPKGKPEYFNQRWEEYTGYNLASAEWTWEDVIHPDDREHALRTWKDCLGKGRHFEAEYRMRTRDGNYRWQLCRAYPLKDAGGNVIQWMGTCTDMDQQKRNEIAQRFLAESGALLARSLDYQATLQKVAELAIPQFAEWASVQLIDEQGKVSTVAVSHFDPENMALARELEQVYAKEFVSRAGTICVPLRARGKTFGAITLVSSAWDYSGRDLAIFEELARCAALAVDNARLFRNAEKAVQTRDEFLSIASHELKTPLTPLKLQLQIIRKMALKERGAGLAPGILEKMLERADKQINRVTRIIDDLLDVSRINLGRMDIELKNTYMAKVIQDVVDHLGDQLASSGCKMEMHLDPSIVGMWDPRRLEQVVVNLVTNAIKYGNRGSIRISTFADNRFAKLVVRDCGIGIAQSDQKRIFALFERAVSADNFGGLGLGLYIVKKIVDQHGGSISVKSRVGEGSTFTVTLPLKPRIRRSRMGSSRWNPDAIGGEAWNPDAIGDKQLPLFGPS